MNERVRNESVTFAHPFSLGSVDGTFPPGTYAVEVTEEQLAGLSFVAYRMVSTTIMLPGPTAAYTSWQRVDIEPSDLAMAKKHDDHV